MKHCIFSKYMIFYWVMNKAHRWHYVGPKESCEKENRAANEEGSDVAPWLVVSAEPAVDAIPQTFPIADFKESIYKTVCPMFDIN